VPGAFSSNKGNDFRVVLEEITESSIPMPKSGRWAKSGMVRSNGCEVAWRTLDAQYWGVPQRRKRIFLVADFGEQRAAEILFKPESVCWYSAAGGSEREGTAGNTQSSIRTTVVAIDHAITTGGNCTAQGPCVKENGPMWTLKASGVHAVCAICLNAKDGQSIKNPQYVYKNGYVVRRLTPTECERLQGLPDGYTAGGSDSARYKALGNGMAQPCADFVMQGIAEVLNKKNI
jgi:DNA (cytosine-5)-methyltransferase 1